MGYTLFDFRLSVEIFMISPRHAHPTIRHLHVEKLQYNWLHSLSFKIQLFTFIALTISSKSSRVISNTERRKLYPQ